jgi:hypothetical protein
MTCLFVIVGHWSLLLPLYLDPSVLLSLTVFVWWTGYINIRHTYISNCYFHAKNQTWAYDPRLGYWLHAMETNLQKTFIAPHCGLCSQQPMSLPTLRNKHAHYHKCCCCNQHCYGSCLALKGNSGLWTEFYPVSMLCSPDACRWCSVLDLPIQ